MLNCRVVLGCVVMGLLTTSGVRGAESVKLKDAASSKIMKPPKGAPIAAFETAAAYSSSGTITIDAPGVTGAQFNKSTAVKVTIQEGTSGSADGIIEFKFGDDPKYVDGGSSVKFSKPVSASAPIPSKFNILYTAQVKIGKDAITIVYTSKLVPLYAQTFINFGSIPGGVKYPEGKSTQTKIVSLDVTVGTFTKKFSSLTYTATTNNKKAKDTSPQLWTGSATGAINFP